MERYFPLHRTDLIPFPLEHILLDKILKDHGKVAVLSVVSCFIEIKLTHIGIQNSSLIFIGPTQTPFSRDESKLRSFLAGKYAREVCKQSKLNLRKNFGRIERTRSFPFCHCASRPFFSHSPLFAIRPN